MSRDLTPTVDRDSMLSLFVGEPLYDAATVRELFVAVGPPPSAASKIDAVAFKLSELGKSFAFDLYDESGPSVIDRQKEAERLARALEAVLRITGVHGGGDLLPMFGQGGLFAAAAIRGEPSGMAATMNALRAVDLLRQDALKLVEIEGRRRRMEAPTAGRPEAKAMQRLVAGISCLYEAAWERDPGVSTDATGEASGPLVRLMVDVTERLRSRGLRFSSSAQSLGKVWRRLDPADKMPTAHILRLAREVKNK